MKNSILRNWLNQLGKSKYDNNLIIVNFSESMGQNAGIIWKNHILKDQSKKLEKH